MVREATPGVTVLYELFMDHPPLTPDGTQVDALVKRRIRLSGVEDCERNFS